MAVLDVNSARLTKAQRALHAAQEELERLARGRSAQQERAETRM